jgi:hypothetical protein
VAGGAHWGVERHKLLGTPKEREFVDTIHLSVSTAIITSL